MKVPACPMPIHQTKLMMANAHATGMLVPPEADAGVCRAGQRGEERAKVLWPQA